VFCSSGGRKSKDAIYNCNSGTSAADSDAGDCVAVSSINPKSCKWIDVGESLTKNDFDIGTIPDGYASSSLVSLDYFLPSNLAFNRGRGTAIVTARSGTSSAQTTVNVYDSKFKRSLGGELDLSSIRNALGKLSSAGGNGCKMDILGAVKLTVSLKACENCQLKEINGLEGELHGGFTGCRIETPAIRIPQTFGLAQVKAFIPWEAELIFTGGVNESCSKDVFCGQISLEGAVGVGAAVCLGDCNVLEFNVYGQGVLTFSGGQICTDGTMDGPKFDGARIKLGGEVRVLNFGAFNVEEEFSPGSLF
jgi:hypothetical protein